jgi:hypothetical protein
MGGLNSDDWKNSLEPVFVIVYYIVEESILSGWESIPGLFKKFTNTGSVLFLLCAELHI